MFSGKDYLPPMFFRRVLFTIGDFWMNFFLVKLSPIGVIVHHWHFLVSIVYHRCFPYEFHFSTSELSFYGW